jgi:flagellar basal body-associated protein FliL
MFCKSCGSEVQEGLRYCNRCGANLAAEAEPAPKLFAIVIILAIAVLLVGIVGIAAVFFFAVELMGRGNIPIETVIFLVVFALVVFGIEALLIKQLSRVLGIYLKQPSPPKKAEAAKQIPEARQDFIAPDSVHTTAAEQETRRFESEEKTRKLK